MRISRVIGSIGLTASLLLSAAPGSASSPSGTPGEFIVVLRDGGAEPGAVAQDMEASHGLSVHHIYGHALYGFAATVPADRLQELRDDARVAYVSVDGTVSVDGKPSGSSVSQPPQSVPTGITRVGADASVPTGAGVAVAVIDTGIDLTHPDLAAHIVANKSCIVGKRNGNDDNGHGSHVAGTIGALDNTIGVVGVAPDTHLVAVKVLNSQGSGSWSSIICGIDWVVANAPAFSIKVASMSLGGAGTSDNACGSANGDALHAAICRMRDAGITTVVAAGNSAANAALSVPAAYDDAVITVSALVDSDGASGGLGAATSYGADDTFARFSNYGSAVDIGAPGVNIRSTWKGGAYNTISGTSMATPHVSGAAALYLQSHPAALWMEVRDALEAFGERVDGGHTDPSGLHPEPVLRASTL